MKSVKYQWRALDFESLEIYSYTRFSQAGQKPSSYF